MFLFVFLWYSFNNVRMTKVTLWIKGVSCILINRFAKNSKICFYHNANIKSFDSNKKPTHWVLDFKVFEWSIQNVTITRLMFTCFVCFFVLWQIMLSGMRPNRSFLSVIMHIRRATPILHSHHLSQKVSEPLTMLSEEEEMMRDTGEL